jgi:hypothetical protein
MSEHEAQEYVDLIVEKLVEWGIIPRDKYGRMTEDQRQELPELVAEKSEE